MTDRQKNLLTLALCVAALVVLGARFLRQPSAPAVETPVAKAVQVPIDLRSLADPQAVTFDTEPPDLHGSPVLAVFVLHSEACTACLNEVDEYLELIRALESSGVRPMGLLFERDPRRARHFLKVSGLPIPIGYGYSEPLAQLLGKFDGQPAFQQIAFIRVADQTLFYRILLPSSVTEPELKQSILERMLAARGGRRALHVNDRKGVVS